MKIYGVLIIFVWWGGCNGRTVTTEDSVVSVYTTQPTTATTGIDVYHQIANNIAERITSPIYRFLGIGNNKTDEVKLTKSPGGKEVLDLPESKEFTPISNSISERDVEELSPEFLKKEERKPEKFTLYSYLPAKESIERNNTAEDDDPFEFDDDDEDDDKEPSGLSYFWELFSSLFQLLWGAVTGYFKPRNSSQT